MRITEKRLQERLKLLQGSFPKLSLQFSNGAVAVVERQEGSGIKTISPYLSNSEMWEWMGGALAAVSLQRTHKGEV